MLVNYSAVEATVRKEQASQRSLQKRKANWEHELAEAEKVRHLPGHRLLMLTWQRTLYMRRPMPCVMVLQAVCVSCSSLRAARQSKSASHLLC